MSPIAERDGADWLVDPGPLAGPAAIDCGLAGTVMRFLPALAATASGEITVDGDEAARRRPMSTVLNALRSLGARIDGDALPFTVHGTGALRGGTVADRRQRVVPVRLRSAALRPRHSPTACGCVHRGGAAAVPAAHRDDRADAALGRRDVDDAPSRQWRVAAGPGVTVDRR